MARRSGDDGDRPKLSWREVDKMRDKAGGGRRAKEERAQQRMERSPVYEQYKAAVSKMFSGGEVPVALRDQLDPSGALKARDELLRRIKKVASEDRKAWADAVREFAEKFDLPDDAYLLVEWLDHPREVVVEKSLEKLEALREAGALAGAKCPKSLDQRLRSLELTGSDPELQARALALRERLKT